VVVEALGKNFSEAGINSKNQIHMRGVNTGAKETQELKDVLEMTNKQIDTLHNAALVRQCVKDLTTLLGNKVASSTSTPTGSPTSTPTAPHSINNASITTAPTDPTTVPTGNETKKDNPDLVAPGKTNPDLHGAPNYDAEYLNVNDMFRGDALDSTNPSTAVLPGKTDNQQTIPVNNDASDYKKVMENAAEFDKLNISNISTMTKDDKVQLIVKINKTTTELQNLKLLPSQITERTESIKIRENLQHIKRAILDTIDLPSTQPAPTIEESQLIKEKLIIQNQIKDLEKEKSELELPSSPKNLPNGLPNESQVGGTTSLKDSETSASSLLFTLEETSDVETEQLNNINDIERKINETCGKYNELLEKDTNVDGNKVKKALNYEDRDILLKISEDLKSIETSFKNLTNFDSAQPQTQISKSFSDFRTKVDNQIKWLQERPLIQINKVEPQPILSELKAKILASAPTIKPTGPAGSSGFSVDDFKKNESLVSSIVNGYNALVQKIKEDVPLDELDIGLLNYTFADLLKLIPANLTIIKMEENINSMLKGENLKNKIEEVSAKDFMSK